MSNVPPFQAHIPFPPELDVATAQEREAAIARLNARQQERNVFTNITEPDVRREMRLHANLSRLILL